MRHNWFDGKRRPSRDSSLWSELKAAFATIKITVISPAHFSVSSQRIKPKGVRALIFVWILVFLGCALFMGEYFNSAPFVFGFIPEYFFSGIEPWRIFTAMFLHGSVIHLLLNSVVFALMAPLLEKDKGTIWLFFIFFTGGFFGFLLHGLFNMSEALPTIGASGGIAAVLGVYPIFYRRAVIMFRVEPTGGSVPAVPLVWFWIVMQLIWSILDRHGSTSYLSHIGGFVSGYIIALLYNKFSRKPKLRVVH